MHSYSFQPSSCISIPIEVTKLSTLQKHFQTFGTSCLPSCFYPSFNSHLQETSQTALIQLLLLKIHIKLSYLVSYTVLKPSTYPKVRKRTDAYRQAAPSPTTPRCDVLQDLAGWFAVALCQSWQLN